MSASTRSRLLSILAALLVALSATRAGAAPPAASRSDGRNVAVDAPAATDAANAVHGAVAAEHPRAAEIGIEILRRGGNAVDATIAVSYAVCVLNSSSCGIGGGGFMLINEPNGRVHALDYRETAPALAHRDLYRSDGAVLSQLSSRGPLAVAVPGEVAGLEAARARFARLSRRELMAPAIALARDGFPISPHMAGTIASNVTALAAEPALAARLLHPDGTPLRAGETLRFPELAATLERVAEQGADAFYRGAVAEQIAATIQSRNGILTTDDLARYRPVWREPLRTQYRGLEILTMPPPSSGGVLFEMLGILANDDLAALGGTSPAYLHLLAEAMKHGFADRARWYGDPAFTDVPMRRLTSREYAKRLRARIRDDATLPTEQYGSAPDHGTTHLSIMDADGRAVACTTTINTAFGAMLVGGDSGVMLNNEMDDFSIAPGVPNAFGLIGGEANAVAPGKRPLSSMSPLIARKAGRPTLVAGGSGGPLIISGTLESLLGIVDFGLDPAAAVAAPRIHTQWMPPVLAVESAIPAATRAELSRRGQSVREMPLVSAVQVVTHERGVFTAAADPRNGGGGATW